MKEEHTIRLNNLVRIPRTRYANKVVFAVKNYIKKHTRAGDENIRLSADVNHAIWARGKQVKVSRLDVVLKKKDHLVYAFMKDGDDLKAFVSKGTPAKKEGKEAKPKAETSSETKKGSAEGTAKAKSAETKPKTKAPVKSAAKEKA